MGTRVSKLEAATFGNDARLQRIQSLTDEELEARLGALIDRILPEFVSNLAAADDPTARDLAARITGRKYGELSESDRSTVSNMICRELEQLQATDAL